MSRPGPITTAVFLLLGLLPRSVGTRATPIGEEDSPARLALELEDIETVYLHAVVILAGDAAFDLSIYDQVEAGLLCMLTASDPASDEVALEAKKDGDGWLLSGTKRLVSDAVDADLFLVSARADDGPGSAGRRRRYVGKNTRGAKAPPHGSGSLDHAK